MAALFTVTQPRQVMLDAAPALQRRRSLTNRYPCLTLVTNELTTQPSQQTLRVKIHFQESLLFIKQADF